MRKILLLPLILILSGIFLAAGPDRTREDVRRLSAKAASGDSVALYRLALLFDTGYDSIPADTAISNALYRESALRGYSPARTILAFRYFLGVGVKKDMDSTLYWLRLAADDGDPGAANNLGYLYASGVGFERDYEKAREWFEKAAAAGIHAAEAQLADLYSMGLGGPTDTLGAIRLYRRAFDRGRRDVGPKLAAILKEYAGKGNPMAMTILAQGYAEGSFVPYNYNLAYEYYLRAALLGDPSAAFIIAELMEIFPDILDSGNLPSIIKGRTGLDYVPSEFLTPAFWYDKAAEAGVTDAESALRRLAPH